jgi:hypothetical protein
LDHGDDTVTVSLGVSSANSSAVSVAVGGDNKITPGAADLGQPTSFAAGVNNNVWALTVTYPQIYAGIKWQLAGNSVATVVGGYALNGRSRARRRRSESAS